MARINRTKEGKATLRATSAWGQDDTGSSWIEKDMLCEQWQMHEYGVKYCMTVFKNPEGKPENSDEYLAVSDFDIRAFSVVN